METQTSKKFEEFESTLEHFLAPISPDNPSGTDVSYDPDYEELKDEVDKLGEGEVVDFGRIESLASNILTEKSKDVRVAVYMTLGLARTRKEEGVALGLAVLRRLGEEYWDDLYPRKAGRRIPMLGFLSTSISTWLERDGNRRQLTDREMLERAVEESQKLAELLREKLADKAPPFARLTRALTDAMPKEAPKSPPEASPAKPVVTPATANAGEHDHAAQAQADEIDDAQSATVAVYQIAAFFRKSEPTNPISYKLVRAAKWRPILRPPDASNGVTRVPPPAKPRMEALQNLSSKGEWAILAQEAEKALQEPGFHFWLELQQLAERALRSAGPEYRHAADAVVSETIQLIDRVPELVELSFNDETPFASYDTREWIDEKRNIATAGQTASGAPEDDETATAVKEAESLAGKGKLNDALEVLARASRSARTGSARFKLDLESATFLRRAGKTELARGVLTDLDRRADEHGLGEWDPTLAVELWTELLALYGKLSTNKGPAGEESRRAASDLMSKLAAVDVTAALKLS